MNSSFLVIFLLHIICVEAQYYFPAIPGITDEIDGDKQDPTSGTITYSINYDFPDNGDPGNSFRFMMDRPSGSPNLPALLTYTFTYNIAPIGGARTNEVSFTLTTNNDEPLELQDFARPIAGSAATNTALAGTVADSRVIRVGDQVILEVNQQRNRNGNNDDGVFSGTFTYELELLDDGRSRNSVLFDMLCWLRISLFRQNQRRIMVFVDFALLFRCYRGSRDHPRRIRQNRLSGMNPLTFLYSVYRQ